MSSDALKPTASSGALVPIRQASRVLYTPRVDILENEDELVLVADVPGVKPDDLDVRFEKDELTIQGRCEQRSFGQRVVRGEYGVGDFYRVFTLSDNIDTDKIAAELTQGVLTVHLPKRAVIKPRRITVKNA